MSKRRQDGRDEYRVSGVEWEKIEEEDEEEDDVKTRRHFVLARQDVILLRQKHFLLRQSGFGGQDGGQVRKT